MEDKKIKFEFRGVEVDLNAYALDITNQVDIRTGEYYEGRLHISFLTNTAEKMFTDDIIYKQCACSGTIEIENQFSGKTIYIDSGELIHGVNMINDVYSTELEFKFKHHRKNSL